MKYRLVRHRRRDQARRVIRRARGLHHRRYVLVVVVIGSAGAGWPIPGRGPVPLCRSRRPRSSRSFQPVRQRLEHLASRLVYGRGPRRAKCSARFSTRMGGAYAAEDLLPRLARHPGRGNSGGAGERRGCGMAMSCGLRILAPDAAPTVDSDRQRDLRWTRRRARGWRAAGSGGAPEDLLGALFRWSGGEMSRSRPPDRCSASQRPTGTWCCRNGLTAELVRARRPQPSRPSSGS
jgi:hypothetical protein